MSLRKKLLVLDVNGLLIDTRFKSERPVQGRQPDGKAGNFWIYNRPFCKEFAQFCLDNFAVGVWSSARLHNVTAVVAHVFGDSQDRLAFIWDQSKCTDTGQRHPANRHKPIFMKKLAKLWMGKEGNEELPWDANAYGPHNTLLVDDSPYKAMANPPFTGIFPATYSAELEDDNELGPNGSAQLYLQKLLLAPDVQKFVEDHPYGVPASFWPIRWPQGDNHEWGSASRRNITEVEIRNNPQTSLHTRNNDDQLSVEKSNAVEVSKKVPTFSTR